ncbi:MAG: 30S ribosomal protein S2 [Patescibacteria group bacterium]|nr:30S ribosomal protein S2 [Patescibacteria group bacterium]
MVKTPTLVEMLEAGVHFGHRTSKWHPKMEKYLFGSRQGIHIINVETTLKALEEALAFCKQTTARGGIVLFVGTKKQASSIVEAAAKDAGMPSITKRWLGGTMTNFSVIAQLLKRFKDLKRRHEKGELGKYTKLEQLKFSEQIKMLEDKVGGIQDMTRIPDAIFIQDIHKDKTALAEAVRRGIKVIAICDSNVNPKDVDYPIPANDDAVKAITLIVGLVGQACKQGKDEWEANRSRLAGTLLQGGPRDMRKPQEKK